jgi:competence protein ComEA
MNQIRNTLENARNWWEDLAFTSVQRKSLLALAILIIASSGVLLLRGTSEEIVAAEVAEIEMPEAVVLLVVDVAGAVLNPGVYSLPINSRVVDAIAAAGNVLKGADVSDINLARILKDGEQIYVYAASRGSTSSRTTARTAPPRNSGPIAINRATAKELEALDGIGPVLASRIIAFRNANGPFVTLESLLEVSGIGPAKFAQFKEKIRL